ncbi:hypothetical protein J2X85_000006 [Microbacterium trichothecenolyticum]|uniref:hypothetical protein n=1 Tax=Microbacterium trichothecenolyticum TaxID=69370 RepID=UPI0028612E7C|nr:hypothetical protein [Microbacterium trichothecenolyticum]MDR7182983.1 hypothetical protein [Microbacterium trichothecenolyticum]
MRGRLDGASRWRLAARLAGAVAAGAILATTLATSATAGVSSSTDDDSTGTMTVEVTDGLPSPSPSPSRTGNGPPVTPAGPPSTVPPRNPGRTTSTAAAVQVTQATIPDPIGADEALGDDVVSTGGALAMSGISASVSPSLELGNGSVTLDVVVRNTSRSTFDSSARFWVDNVFGGRVVEVDDVQVDALEPDETRRIAVTVEGLGQHVVLRSYMTLTPPPAVDGLTLTALSRNKAFAVTPLFSVSLASIAAVLSGVAWWVFSPRGLGLRWRRWGA